MASTPIDLADTAIKIGLGAAITAVVSLLAPFVMFTKEVLADRRARRLKMIEDVITLFEGYHNHQMFALMARANYNLLKDDVELGERVRRRFLDARDKQDEYDFGFNRAVARLELLGKHDIAQAFRDYDEFIENRKDDILEASSEAKILALYSALKGEVGPKRRAIYEKLGAAYDIEPELSRMRDFDGRVI